MFCVCVCFFFPRVCLYFLSYINHQSPENIFEGYKWGKYLKVIVSRVKTYKSSNQVRCSEGKKGNTWNMILRSDWLGLVVDCICTWARTWNQVWNQVYSLGELIISTSSWDKENRKSNWLRRWHIHSVQNFIRCSGEYPVGFSH